MILVATVAGGCNLPASREVRTLSVLAAPGPLPGNPAARIPRDLGRLQELSQQLEDFQRTYGGFLSELDEQVVRSGRRHYELHEEASLREHFSRALTLRRDLLALVETYAGFDRCADEPLRSRCRAVAAAATLMCHELDVYLAVTQTSRMAQRKCNEPCRAMKIPADAFDTICLAAAAPESREFCLSLLAGDPGGRFALTALGEDAFATVRARRAWTYIQSHQERLQGRVGAVRAARAAEAAFATVYEAQRALALAAANLRLDRRGSITASQAGRVARVLQPGDILLRRRYGNFTNNFVPGFWTHAAIYLGTTAQMRRSGLVVPPEAAVDASGQWVIEARAAGVVLTSLVELLDADFVLVLRPQLGDEKVLAALRRAMSYHGCPYDYDFDAFTADRLTCGELIWRAYGEQLGMTPQPMERGRDMLLPDRIAREYARDGARGRTSLNFVLMLTSAGPQGPARFAPPDEMP